jgi:hypothetical protein
MSTSTASLITPGEAWATAASDKICWACGNTPASHKPPVKARAVAALIHPVHRLGSALRSGNFLATAIHVQFCEWM